MQSPVHSCLVPEQPAANLLPAQNPARSGICLTIATLNTHLRSGCQFYVLLHARFWQILMVAVAAYLGCAGFAWPADAKQQIGGLRLGKATYAQAAASIGHRKDAAELATKFQSLPKAIRVAKLKHRGVAYQAVFLFDRTDTLGAVALSGSEDEVRSALLGFLGRSTHVASKDFYATGDLRLQRLANDGGARQTLVVATARHFEVLEQEMQVKSAGGLTTRQMIWLGIGGVITMLVVTVAYLMREELRQSAAKHRLSIADHALAAAIYLTGAAYVDFLKPAGFGDWQHGALSIAVGMGWIRLLAFSITTTRTSGWLTGTQNLGYSFAAAILSPVLLIPAIAKRAWQAGWYFGMVLVYGGIVGAAYRYRHMLPPVEITVPLVSLVSPGVFRAYITIYRWPVLTSRFVQTAASTLLWPAVLCFGLLYFALMTLITWFSRLWIILPAAIAGALFDALPIGLLIGITLASIDVLFSFSAAAFGSTGYGSGAALDGRVGYDGGFSTGGDMTISSMDFGGDFTVNPANGMPMIGGFGGIDTFGNTYGTNHNDPF